MSDHIHASKALAAPRTEEERQASEERAARDPSLWASLLTRAVVERLPSGLELGAPEPRAEANSEREAPRSTPGEAAGDDGSSPAAARGGSGVSGAEGSGDAALEQLDAELSLGELGKVLVRVARGSGGLGIVIGVADTHVKALIEAERVRLLETLKAAGLHVARVEVLGNTAGGTALAPHGRMQSPAIARAHNAKVRAYRTLEREEPEDESRNVDVTA